jgi:hypothetical protein
MAREGGLPIIRYDLGALPPMASSYLPQIVLVNAPVDIYVGGVNISLPLGAIVSHAIAMISFRSIYNTNVALNWINGGQDIQCFDPITGNLIPVFTFGGSELATDPASYSGGDVLIGYDFANTLANPTGLTLTDGDFLSFQWTGAQSLLPNLNINDIQIILRLWVS